MQRNVSAHSTGRAAHSLAMGAWGAAIFSDDLALDIRGDYRELLEDQVPDEEATRRVVDSYRHLDVDQEHLLWLALAAAQSELGRLDEDVKARALAVIDTGRGLELWEEAGSKELAKRKAVLAKLRDQLTAPQPLRKRVKRPWRHETDLQAGDVLSFTASNGQMALLRVARVDDHRVGAAPILLWLDWQGHSLPPNWRLRRLKTRGMQRPMAYRVARHRKKDPDWRDSGFRLATRIPPRRADKDSQAWLYTTWHALQSDLRRQLMG